MPGAAMNTAAHAFGELMSALGAELCGRGLLLLVPQGVGREMEQAGWLQDTVPSPELSPRGSDPTPSQNLRPSLCGPLHSGCHPRPTPWPASLAEVRVLVPGAWKRWSDGCTAGEGAGRPVPVAWLSTPSPACQLRDISFYMIHRNLASVTSATSPKDNQRPELAAHPHPIPIRCSPGEGQRAEPHPHPGTGRRLEREASKYILRITHYYNSAAEGRDVRRELGIQSTL